MPRRLKPWVDVVRMVKRRIEITITHLRHQGTNAVSEVASNWVDDAAPPCQPHLPAKPALSEAKGCRRYGRADCPFVSGVLH
ncbi:MAG: hypothetical protein ACRD3T_15600 [Terriglobia bacterium]